MVKEDHRTRVAAERRDRMRRRLFASAIQLVAKQGTATTSIDDVIRTADVSRGTFYKYFDAVDTLFDQLALVVLNEIIETVEPGVIQFEHPAERMATGMRMVVQLVLANRQIAGFLVRMGWPETRGGEVLMDLPRRDLEEGFRRGKFVAMPMELALNIVSMTVLGSVHALLAPRVPAGFVDQAVASALRALGVQHKDAVRIASMPLPAATPVEGGLLELPLAAGSQRKAVARRRPAGG